IDGSKINYFQGGTEREEAFFVTEKIQSLISSGEYKPHDIAILYRTNAQSRAIEDTLMKSNIAYQMVEGTKYYDRKEIKDMDDDLSFERVVNEPKRGIGRTSVDRLRAYAADHDISLSQAIKEVDFTGVTPRAANALSKFDELITNFMNQQEFLSATEMVEQVLVKTGYEDMLKKEHTIESESRLENLEEFKTVTKNFEETSEEDQSLTIFLTDLALIADID